MKIALYYNPTCPDCVRRAARTARMDWLNRVALHAGESPLGEVPVGEIVVVDRRSGRAHTGIDAVRKLCLQIPLYFPYGLYLQFEGNRGRSRASERAAGSGERTMSVVRR